MIFQRYYLLKHMMPSCNDMKSGRIDHFKDYVIVFWFMFFISTLMLYKYDIFENRRCVCISATTHGNRTSTFYKDCKIEVEMHETNLRHRVCLASVFAVTYIIYVNMPVISSHC